MSASFSAPIIDCKSLSASEPATGGFETLLKTSATKPFFTVQIIGSTIGISPSVTLIEPSKTITPSQPPTIGLIKTSPAGIFPPVPGIINFPSSEKGLRFSTGTKISVPPGDVTFTETAFSKRLQSFWQRSSSKA